MGKAERTQRPGGFHSQWFVKLLVRIAKLPRPMLPHPVFQVAGHACVERSLGFVGHDVDRRLFHDGCTVMIPAFAGMTGEACVGGNPWFLFSFSMITLRHSRVGGNPSNTTQAS